MLQEGCTTAREFPGRETLLRLALGRRHGGNPRALRLLLATAGSLEWALADLDAQPQHVRELLAPLCVDDVALRAMVTPELRFLRESDASVLWGDDDVYPPLLAEISAPPSLLFCRGDVALLSRPQVAIVGSRHASAAGLAIARAFAADLAAAGFVITSGLALGIDAMAHEGALAAGGDTVAVLGCGADRIYPRRHIALAGKIREHGCLVSELSPGTEPLASHFPQRNRIISGLTLGVLVVEAATDSGSLITARFAAEQGREVFAIPGSIHSPMSRGCHQLIREGATLVETSTHLLDALAHFVVPSDRQAREPARSPGDVAPALPDGDAAKLVAAMSAAGSGIDELAMRSGMAASKVSMLLNDLLMRGMVHALPGGLWQPGQPVVSRVG